MNFSEDAIHQRKISNSPRNTMNLNQRSGMKTLTVSTLSSNQYTEDDTLNDKADIYDWSTVPAYKVPYWLEETPAYITRNHRPQLCSMKLCLQSIFRLHSETMNIWTHLLGTVIALILMCKSMNSNDFGNNIMLIIMGLCVVFCFFTSTVFHIFCCHSEPVCEILNRADYLGIIALIPGCIIPWVHILFKENPYTKTCYYVFMLLVSVKFGMFLAFSNSTSYTMRIFRTVIFIVLGVGFILTPIIHYAIVNDLTVQRFWTLFKWIFISGSLFVIGACIYALRVPESLYPGRFNVWFQSHSIFHVIVMIGAFIHTANTYNYLTCTKYCLI